MSYPDPPADPGPAAFPAEYPALPTPLAGYTLTVSSALVGAKVAIQQGGTLFISPAMWALLSTAASQAELKLLLDNIRVLKLPAFSVYSPVYTLTSPVPPPAVDACQSYFRRIARGEAL